MFYQNLTCELEQRGTEGFGAYLEEMLPEFGRRGSGDDVSVGGIVDLERIGEHVSFFREEIERYRLKEELARYESRKISMSRKHEILGRRAEEAKQRMEEAERQLERMLAVLPFSQNAAPVYEQKIFKQNGEAFRKWEKKKQQLAEWKEKVRALGEEYRKAQEEFAEYDVGYQEVLAGIERVGAEMDDLIRCRTIFADNGPNCYENPVPYQKSGCMESRRIQES